MIITVHLHTVLQQQTPNGLLRTLEVSVSEGSTIEDVLASLQISMNPEDLLIAVNGRVAQETQMLDSGDRVDFIPAISGGTRSETITI